MKKSLVALAALAVVGAASAQSSVTLFGVVDANVGSYRTADNGSATKMNTSGLSSSRLGFRGVEDLGGGMSAGFWLEAGLNPDAGIGQNSTTNNQAAVVAAPSGLVFNRRSTVSLMGNFGEVRLGRDYTPSFWNTTVFDPFGTLGVAQSSNLNGAGFGGAATNNVAAASGVAARVSNSVAYQYNQGAGPVGNTGLYGSAQIGLGEKASNTTNNKDGSYIGFRIGYQQGPLNVAVATGKIKAADVGDYTQTNLGVSYDLGVANLIGAYNRNNSGVSGTRYNTYMIGATIPMGQGYIPVSYNRTTINNAAGSKAGQFGIGYVYNLSKRTAVYTTFAQINNSNGAAFGVSGGVGGFANKNSSGVEFGVKHSF